MSGRSGYRKGHHPALGRFAVERVSRRTPDEMPDWRLFFVLPAELGFAIADGPYPGVIGVNIFRGCAIVTGKNKQWVLDQAAAFLMKAARELMPLHIAARLTRDEAEMLHPPRREEEGFIEIVVASGKPVVVMASRFMRAVVHAGR